jgi:hypothetical protein
LFGVHVQVAERRHRDGLDRVVEGSERAQWGEQLVGLGRVTDVVGLDDHERLAAQRLGDFGDRR